MQKSDIFSLQNLDVLLFSSIFDYEWLMRNVAEYSPLYDHSLTSLKKLYAN